jgi:hypothetical protein
MSERSGLTVRQFQRREVDLPAQFDVAEAHQQQVRFSAASGSVDAHSLPVRTVDMSPGGAGLASTIFLPRACEGRLRIFSTTPVEVRGDGSPVYEVAFEHRVKVRRTILTGHEPSYFVGVSFVDPAPDLEERIARVLADGARGEGGPERPDA